MKILLDLKFLINQIYICCYVVLSILFVSCNNQPQKVAFPFEETEFKDPKKEKVTPLIRQIPNNLTNAKYITKKGQLIKRDQSIPLNLTSKKKANPPKIIENRLRKRKITDSPKKRLAGIPKAVEAIGKKIPALGKRVKARLPHSRPFMLPAVRDQDNYGFRNISQDQSLPGTVGYVQLEDSRGRLWIGTDNGLAMLEGGEMKIYTTKEGLSSNRVLSLMESSSGAIWVGTRGGGINVLESGYIIHYGIKQGLSNNRVRSILESSTGAIWIGTDGGGLDVLQSDHFLHYGTKEGLSSNRVYSLMESSSGAIWIGTSEGVDVFKSDHFLHYGIEEGLSSNQVSNILESSTGAIWIGTNGAGLDVLESGNFLHYGVEDGLCNNRVWTLMESSTGAIWIGTIGGGVDVLESDRFIHYGTKEGLSGDRVRSLLESSSGSIWIGTAGGGVDVLDSNGFLHFGKEDGLSSNRIVNLIESSTGAIWMGYAEGGVDVLEGDHFLHYGIEEGLKSNRIRSLMESSTGSIWIGNTEQGVDVFESGNFLHYGTGEGLSSNRIRSLMESSTGAIWIGTIGGGINVLDSDNIIHYGTKEGLSSNNVLCLLESSNGSIWIGTDGGGVDVFESDTFHHYDKERGLSSNSVRCLLESSTGAIWIGTAGGGVDIFESGSFLHYGIEEGLVDDAIFQLAMDSLGNIWAGTGKGMTRFMAKDEGYELTSWDKSHGLKFMDFNGPGNPMLFTKTDEVSPIGTMWSGVGGVLTAFEPPLVDDTRPVLFLTGLDIGQKAIDWSGMSLVKGKVNIMKGKKTEFLFSPEEDSASLLTSVLLDTSSIAMAGIRWSGIESLPPYHLPQNLELPYDQNHLTFHYSGMKFSEQFDIVYRYMLEGMDKKWSPFTQEGKADYRSLPPGTYTFKVRARGRNFLWSDEEQISFVVHPPWWLIWWLKILYVALSISVLYSIYRRRVTGLEQQKKELGQIVSERTAELKSKNERIVRQAEELLAFNESLNELNANLEQTVDERTNELTIKNHKLSEYAFINAHNMRVPVANIKGIIQLFGKTRSMEDTMELIDMLRGQSEKLDNVLFDIQKMLEEDSSISAKELVSKAGSEVRKK